MTKQHVKMRFAFGTALALVICLAVTSEIIFASAGQVQAKLTNAAHVVKFNTRLSATHSMKDASFAI